MRLRGELSGTTARESWPAAVTVLVSATLLVGSPLVIGRALAGHDVVFYLMNAQQTAENLRSGLLFPAWGGGYNAGFGAPTLLFFPPLTSYLHAIPILAGLPVIFGVSFWSISGLLISGLAMYGWLRSAELGGAALPAAVIYLVASYRLIDLYQRSALAEHWAFVWPPLIVWAATAADIRWPLRSALTALPVAALLLSNTPLAALFGIALAVWFVVSGDLSGRRRSVLIGAALGFGMAAFSLVPQLLSSSLLSVDRYYGADAGRFRPSANTLFSGDLSSWDFNSQVSVALCLTAAAVLAAYLLVGSDRRRRPVVRATAVAAVICVLAAAKPAGVLWDVLPVLSKLQFPWRVASLLTFAVVVMAAHLDRRRGWLMVGLVAVTSLPFAGWEHTRPAALFRSEQPSRTMPGTLFPDPHTAWEAGSGGWYWRHHTLAEIWFIAANVPPFLLPELAGSRAPQLDLIRGRPAVLVDDAAAPVDVVSWGSVRRELVIDAPAAGTVMWRAIEFPVMAVEVDGTAVAIAADPVTGLVVHHVPAGRHRLVWTWSPFPALRWARRVSICSMSIAGLLLVLALKPGRRRSEIPGSSDPGRARSPE